MKTSMKIPDGLVAAMLAILVISGLNAQDSTWNSTIHGGLWNVPGNWSNGVPNGQNHIARFTPATGATTPSVVNIDGTVTLGQLVLQNYSTPGAVGNTGWILDGGTINFSVSSGGRNVYISDWDSQVTGTTLTIRSAVTADGTLNLYGNNTTTNPRAVLRWEAASTNAATISLFRTTISVDAVAGKLGTGDIWMRESGALANFIQLTNAANDAATAGVFSNNLILNSRYTNALVGAYFHNTSAWNINVTGMISEWQVSGTPSNMSYRAGSSGNGGTRFVVSGNNSYTGNTMVGGGNTGPVIVRATHNNAFGTGSANVTLNAARDTVELTGGVTISNKTLQTKGGGYINHGALNSLSGNNRWNGNIQLGGSEDNIIGVQGSSFLAVGGVISGAQKLRKVGSGTLVLEEDNTFSAGLDIAGGMVRVDSAAALGTGNVHVASHGFVAGLHINTGTIQATASNLILGTDAILVFDLTGLTAENTPIFSIAGNQTGNGTYTVEILGADSFDDGIFHLMTIGNTYEAANFVLGGSTIPPGYLIWENGLLSYHAIPEPATLGLMLLGLGGIIFHQRRGRRNQDNC